MGAIQFLIKGFRADAFSWKYTILLSKHMAKTYSLIFEKYV
jgi:hypothetical protein